MEGNRSRENLPTHERRITSVRASKRYILAISPDLVAQLSLIVPRKSLQPSLSILFGVKKYFSLTEIEASLYRKILPAPSSRHGPANE